MEYYPLEFRCSSLLMMVVVLQEGVSYRACVYDRVCMCACLCVCVCVCVCVCFTSVCTKIKPHNSYQFQITPLRKIQDVNVGPRADGLQIVTDA